MKPLKLWEPLISLLSSQESAIRMHIAWVIGTAIQNNPTSKKDFFEAGGLEPILKLLGQDEDVQVRNKALYGVSSLIRQYPEALESFIQLSGFDVMSKVLKDADLNIARRVMFLIMSLYQDDSFNTSLSSALVNAGFPNAMISFLENSEDEDLLEKICNAIVAWHEKDQVSFDTFSSSLEKALRALKKKGNLNEDLLKVIDQIELNIKKS